MPRVSPRRRSKLIPSTARTAPICRWKTTPRVIGKCLTRFSTARIGSPRTFFDGLAGAVIADLLREVARAGSAVAEDQVVRYDVHADLLDVRAPGVEGAAGGNPHQVRR